MTAIATVPPESQITAPGEDPLFLHALPGLLIILGILLYMILHFVYGPLPR